MCICHSILSTVARNGGQLPQSSGVKNVTPEYFIMIKEEDKNEVLGRIIEKLQNSPLFLDMKADLQVGFNYWFSYLTQITAAAKGMGETGQFRVLKRVVLLFFFFFTKGRAFSSYDEFLTA